VPDAQAKANATRCKAQKSFQKAQSPKCKNCACKGNPPECALYAYSPNCCPENETPHHVLPGHCFRKADIEGKAQGGLRTTPNYVYEDAPCICVEGAGKEKEHGELHDKIDQKEKDHREAQGGTWSYAQASKAAAESVHELKEDCSEECIKAQLDDYHKKKPKPGIKDDTRLRADPWGKKYKDLPAKLPPLKSNVLQKGKRIR